MTLLVLALVVYFQSEHASSSMDNATGERRLTLWAFAAPARQMNQMKSRFEAEHPGVRLEIQTIPWDNLQQKTLWAVAANSDVPDVVVGSSEWMGGLVAAGALKPLDRLITSATLDTFFPAALGVYQFPRIDRERPTYRGPMTQYGLPLDIDFMMIYYRHDLLSPLLGTLGMTEFPKDWQNFRRLTSAVAKGRASRSLPFYFTSLDPDDPVPLTMAFLPAAGARVMQPGYKRTDLDSPEAADALELFGAMLSEGSALRWERATQQDPLVLLKTGRVAAIISGPWYARILEEKAPEMAGKWRVATFPRRLPSNPTTGLGGACLAIPHNAKNQADALALMRFMTSTDFALGYFEGVGSPPTQMAAWNDPRFQQTSAYFGGQNINSVIRYGLETARPLELLPSSEVARGPLRRAMVAVGVEGAQPSDAMRDAAQIGNAILQELE
jgi:multiple sugar transport system substrate-binding protein